MNRKSAVQCLHEELGAWPKPTTLLADVPSVCGWRWDVDGEVVRLVARDGMTDPIAEADWLASAWVAGEERMEAIGPNGPTGDHYAEDSDGESALSQALREDPHEALTFGPTKGRAGGLKFDSDKPRMELLIQGMPRALEAVGQVLTFGAEKYAAHSWRHVEDNHNRYWAAKSRHELARAKGEERDPETGLLHLAHEACNALFLLELALMEDGQ